MVELPDWEKVYALIVSNVRHAVKGNEKISSALTFAEGDDFVNTLSSRISYDVHRLVDPEYDA